VDKPHACLAGIEPLILNRVRLGRHFCDSSGRLATGSWRVEGGNGTSREEAAAKEAAPTETRGREGELAKCDH
jgi:hypothetical protein